MRGKSQQKIKVEKQPDNVNDDESESNSDSNEEDEREIYITEKNNETVMSISAKFDIPCELLVSANRKRFPFNNCHDPGIRINSRLKINTLFIVPDPEGLRFHSEIKKEDDNEWEWEPIEDVCLSEAVANYGKKWKEILYAHSDILGKRTEGALLRRWEELEKQRRKEFEDDIGHYESDDECELYFTLGNHESVQ